jgi:predicted metal-dependent hydrolase
MQQRDTVRYGTIIIPYNIIKTGRIKTSEVIVDANTITVRAPLKKDRLLIQKLVLNKASWILKKQKEYRETIPELTRPSFKQNGNLLYLGYNYPLKINRGQTKDSIDLVNEKFVVNTKSLMIKANYTKKLYEKWLREKSQDIFYNKIQNYSKKLGVEIKQLIIKNLRNRWGSLTKNGAINLNFNLLKAPDDVIDYIVLHELCHLKIKEHSHHYWTLLYKFMPSYHEKIEWLRVNGGSLL